MFSLSKSADCFEIVFSAELANVDKAHAATEEFITAVGIKDKAFDILLVMRELLNNAVIHGCKNLRDKKVRYSLEQFHDLIAMAVEDEGEGFDWKAAMEKELELESDHGRGMPIIKIYCSDFSFNKKGNSLIVKFNL